MERDRGDARTLEAAQLIAHQRDERRDDDDRRDAHGRRQLIEQRFAGPRGHDGERVAPLEQSREDGFLSRQKILMPEARAQHAPRLLHIDGQTTQGGPQSDAARGTSTDMRTSSDRLLALHFHHQPGAMGLHCAHADAELVSDDLIGPALEHADQHLALPQGEAGQPIARRRGLGAEALALDAAAQRLMHRAEQRLIVEGLFQKIDGAGLHRLNRERHIGMGGDDDDRQIEMSRLDLDEQLQAAGAGHAHIGDDAASLARLDARQKIARGRMGAHVEILCFQKKPQGIADGGVIVDDMNDGGNARHARAPPIRGPAGPSHENPKSKKPFGRIEKRVRPPGRFCASTGAVGPG